MKGTAGRPAAKPSKVIPVRFLETECEEIKQAASEDGMKVSTWIKYQVALALKRRRIERLMQDQENAA